MTTDGSMPTLRPLAAALFYLLLAASLPSCASSEQDAGPPADALITLSDPEARVGTRIKAAGYAWDAVEAGAAERDRTRTALKTIAWATAAPVDLRTAAMDAILRDQTEAGIADSKRVVGLMLMRERNEAMVEYLSLAIADRDWKDLTTPLVRSYARPIRNVFFRDRVEGEALARLHPGVPLSEVVFAVVLDPDIEQGPYGVRFDERARADAWELLTTIDPSGATRARLIGGGEAEVAVAGGVKMIEDLRAGLDDLLVIPATAEEVFWLGRLRDPGERVNAEWWRRTRAAIASLSGEQRLGLELRHAEPIRWAAANQSGWLRLNRDELVQLTRERLANRETHRRKSFGATELIKSTESLDEALPQMVWADVLSLLVTDEALRGPAIANALSEQVRLDRADRTTEYGGILEATELAADPFRLSLYPPRARTRTGDRRFVASEDMVEASDRALAHYHLQVQNANQERFAGPSAGDLYYAARSGRTCVVLTSIDDGIVNVDYYQPDGAIVDLGEIRFEPAG